MSSLFDKLDLRPQERRLVVIVGIVVFVVLNLWLVLPMFGDYGRNEQRIKDFRSTLKKYQDEINKKPGYEKELKELETRGGYVPTEEAGLRLSTEVSSQAALSGVTITSMTTMSRTGSPGGKTNAFFDEAAVTVNVNSGEKEFIDFLWRLADKETLIRAKSMQLGPDLPGRMRLQGQITLVKSFQRRPPPRATVPTTKPAGASATTTPAEVPTKSNTVVRTNARPVSPPVTPTTGPKPPPNVTPGTPPAMPSPIPAPTPSGGTNRMRRALPTPARP